MVHQSSEVRGSGEEYYRSKMWVEISGSDRWFDFDEVERWDG
jgi:hypothetical protein